MDSINIKVIRSHYSLTLDLDSSIVLFCDLNSFVIGDFDLLLQLLVFFSVDLDLL